MFKVATPGLLYQDYLQELLDSNRTMTDLSYNDFRTVYGFGYFLMIAFLGVHFFTMVVLVVVTVLFLLFEKIENPLLFCFTGFHIMTTSFFHLTPKSQPSNVQLTYILLYYFINLFVNESLWQKFWWFFVYMVAIFVVMILDLFVFFEFRFAIMKKVYSRGVYQGQIFWEDFTLLWFVFITGIMYALGTFLESRRMQKKIKILDELEDIDLVLEEQRSMRDHSIAHLKINKTLFEVQPEEMVFKKLIGGGGSGATIYLCTYREQDYAFKSFKMIHVCATQTIFDEFEREVEILASIAHPHIVKFYGFFFHLFGGF